MIHQNDVNTILKVCHENNSTQCTLASQGSTGTLLISCCFNACYTFMFRSFSLRVAPATPIVTSTTEGLSKASEQTALHVCFCLCYYKAHAAGTQWSVCRLDQLMNELHPGVPNSNRSHQPIPAQVTLTVNPPSGKVFAGLSISAPLPNGQLPKDRASPLPATWDTQGCLLSK